MLRTLLVAEKCFLQNRNFFSKEEDSIMHTLEQKKIISSVLQAAQDVCYGEDLVSSDRGCNDSVRYTHNENQASH